MFWEYSRKESKVLLIITLLLFTTGALLLTQYWRTATDHQTLTANSVGVYAGVEANELNTLATQLNEKEESLIAREQALVRAQRGTSDEWTLYIVALVGASLLGLILMNFYLDSKRRRSLA